MGYTIALAGKGGSGKTTIAALIVRLLKEKKAGSILAVDADPNSNLAETLGIKSDVSIGSLIDEVAAHPEKIPAGMTKDRFIEYQVQTAVAEGDGFDLLTMGRPEGPGCYCYANNVLRGCMVKLLNGYDYIIIDNEAGLEHLSRRTTRSADTLLVVATPTSAGLRAAQRISALVSELNISTGRKRLLINCAGDSDETRKYTVDSLVYIGSIPLDAQIEEISRRGQSLFNLPDTAPGITELQRLGDALWQ